MNSLLHTGHTSGLTYVSNLDCLMLIILIQRRVWDLNPYSHVTEKYISNVPLLPDLANSAY